MSVAASAYFTSTSGFYSDDFINFREVQVEDGLSVRFLLSPTSAHFAPAHKLGDWLLQNFAPLNFPVAQALLLLGFAASLFLFHRLLRELFDPAPALVLTLLYGASTVHVANHQWWSSGLDRVPATLLTFLSILAYLWFHRLGSRRWLAVSVGASALALLFSVKPIFIPLYLILLRVLLLRPDEPVRTSVTAALREWWVWILYLVPVTLFLVVYARGYESGGQLNPPSSAALGRFLVNLWFRVVAPGAFGVYVPQTNDTTLAITAFVGVQLVIVAGVLWTLVRRRAAWRAWLFLAITFLANALAVGLTRLGGFGPRQAAYVLPYNIEFAYLGVIGVGAAVLGTCGARPPSAARHHASGGFVGARALMATGLASFLALTWWGSHRISQPDVWPGPTSRAYVERVEAFLARSERLGIRPVLVDGMAPKPVMYPTAGPWTSHSEVLPVMSSRRFMPACSALDPAVGGLHQVDQLEQLLGSIARLVRVAPEQACLQTEQLPPVSRVEGSFCGASPMPRRAASGSMVTCTPATRADPEVTVVSIRTVVDLSVPFGPQEADTHRRPRLAPLEDPLRPE